MSMICRPDAAATAFFCGADGRGFVAAAACFSVACVDGGLVVGSVTACAPAVVGSVATDWPVGFVAPPGSVLSAQAGDTPLSHFLLLNNLLPFLSFSSTKKKDSKLTILIPFPS